jgi:hypothetical protein
LEEKRWDRIFEVYDHTVFSQQVIEQPGKLFIRFVAKSKRMQLYVVAAFPQLKDSFLAGWPDSIVRLDTKRFQTFPPIKNNQLPSQESCSL